MDHVDDSALSGERDAQRALIVVCCVCRKRLQRAGEWIAVEMKEPLDTVRITHGLCPTCLRRIYPSCSRSDISHSD